MWTLAKCRADLRVILDLLLCKHLVQDRFFGPKKQYKKKFAGDKTKRPRIHLKHHMDNLFWALLRNESTDAINHWCQVLFDHRQQQMSTTAHGKQEARVEAQSSVLEQASTTALAPSHATEEAPLDNNDKQQYNACVKNLFTFYYCKVPSKKALSFATTTLYCTTKQNMAKRYRLQSFSIHYPSIIRSSLYLQLFIVVINNFYLLNFIAQLLLIYRTSMCLNSNYSNLIYNHIIGFSYNI